MGQGKVHQENKVGKYDPTHRYNAQDSWSLSKDSWPNPKHHTRLRKYTHTIWIQRAQ